MSVSFFAGIGVGSNTKAWELMKTLHFKILLVPFSAILGTFSGVLACLPFFPTFSAREALAIGSGFGYYSLSTILIKELHGETLAIIALISNIIREFCTFFLTPLLIGYFGKITPISVAGATCMDATLPLMTKFLGKQYALIAACSGAILTVLVPFLIFFLLTAT